MNFPQIIIFMVVAFIGCAQPGKKTELPPTLDEMLNERIALYKSLMPMDSFGFIETDKCDSLLLTALANPSAQLTAAENAPGEWYRRPTIYPECFESGESRSTISRDGIWGVVYWAFLNRNLDVLKQLWDYIENSGGILGKNGWQHAVVTPQLLAILAEALFQVSEGKYNYSARLAIMPELSLQEPGYRQHLQGIVIMLIRLLGKGESASSAIKLSVTNPDNPFFAALAGDREKAARILLLQWPESGLPTSSNWCADWYLSEAPNGEGKQPCPQEGRVHSGGDFLFVARLLR